jgi:hypothetical protein
VDIPRLIEVTPLAKYRLRAGYADGTTAEVDLAHLAGRGIFKNFQRVSVSEAGAIRWNDEVEICGDAVYLRITGKTIPQPALASGHV